MLSIDRWAYRNYSAMEDVVKQEEDMESDCEGGSVNIKANNLIKFDQFVNVAMYSFRASECCLYAYSEKDNEYPEHVKHIIKDLKHISSQSLYNEQQACNTAIQMLQSQLLQPFVQCITSEKLPTGVMEKNIYHHILCYTVLEIHQLLHDFNDNWNVLLQQLFSQPLYRLIRGMTPTDKNMTPLLSRANNMWFMLRKVIITATDNIEYIGCTPKNSNSVTSKYNKLCCTLNNVLFTLFGPIVMEYSVSPKNRTLRCFNCVTAMINFFENPLCIYSMTLKPCDVSIMNCNDFVNLQNTIGKDEFNGIIKKNSEKKKFNKVPESNRKVLQYGKDNEANALDVVRKYVLQNWGCNFRVIANEDLHLSKYRIFGCTPDGFVYFIPTSTIVATIEVKCPFIFKDVTTLSEMVWMGSGKPYAALEREIEFDIILDDHFRIHNNSSHLKQAYFQAQCLEVPLYICCVWSKNISFVETYRTNNLVRKKLNNLQLALSCCQIFETVVPKYLPKQLNPHEKDDRLFSINDWSADFIQLMKSMM